MPSRVAILPSEQGRKLIGPPPDGVTVVLWRPTDPPPAEAAEAGFCVLGAAYPEPHPSSRGDAADLAHLRAKVEAGVRVLVTQLFFDNDDYRRFVERANVDVPAPWRTV